MGNNFFVGDENAASTLADFAQKKKKIVNAAKSVDTRPRINKSWNYIAYGLNNILVMNLKFVFHSVKIILNQEVTETIFMIIVLF